MNQTPTENQVKGLKYIESLGKKFFQTPDMTEKERTEIFQDPATHEDYMDMARGAAMTIGGFPLIDQVWNLPADQAQKVILDTLEDIGSKLEHD